MCNYNSITFCYVFGLGTFLCKWLKFLPKKHTNIQTNKQTKIRCGSKGQGRGHRNNKLL